MVSAKKAREEKQARLKTRVAAARPLGHRLHDMGAQITKRQKLRDDQEKKLVGIKERLKALRDQDQKATAKLAALGSQMGELSEQRRQLEVQAAAPGGGDEAAMDE